MVDMEIIDPPDVRRGYAVTLALGTAFAGVGGAAFWASQNLQPAQPVLWEGVSLAAALIAAKLGFAATKQWRELNRLHASERLWPQGLLASFNEKLDAAATALGATPESDSGQPAQTPDKKPERSALEVERERLRQGGFTAAEISQILIAREMGGGHGGMGGGAAGVLTGVLSNLTAVMAHVRNFLPSLKADLAKMLNRRSSLDARLTAFGTVILKAAVVVVLAYVVSLEFTQLKATVDKTKAEACSARMKMIAETLTQSEWVTALPEYSRDCGPHP